jgi:hypothetical protein
MLIPAASHSGASAALTALFKSDLEEHRPGNMNILRPPQAWLCGTRGLRSLRKIYFGTLTRSTESIHRFPGPPKDRLLY